MRVNPVFSRLEKEGTFENSATIGGVCRKTALLLALAIISGLLAVYRLANNQLSVPFLIGAMIGAFVSSLVGQLSPKASMVCSIIYSICEGTLLGIISIIFEAQYQGIVMTAILLTVILFSVTLVFYRVGALRATPRFVRIMSTLGLTILIISLIYMISFFVNPNNVLIQTLQAAPGLLIGISLLILIYATLMLVLDFERINAISNYGYSKEYEWMASLGLMLTIVWIYVEALRILAIIADRKD